LLLIQPNSEMNRAAISNLKVNFSAHLREVGARSRVAIYRLLGSLWPIALCLPSVAAPADVAPIARFYSVNGAKLYTEISGHGRPILFLHGGLQFFDNAFPQQREVFAADHTVIGIDQRSHGHSPDGAWALSYQGMADDTAAVLKLLNVGPVDVIGHSDGGNVALILAHDYPQLVHRVVISGANLRSGVSVEELEQRRHWPKAQLAPILDRIDGTLPPRFKTDYAKVSVDGAAHWMTFLEKSYFLWMTPTVIEPVALKQVSAPVLVIAGDHDFTSIEDTTEIYRALPHGQLLIVPGTGHGTLDERPQLLNLAIREFLEQEPAGH
jgi:pimeloyl-ACP methyl ester carboxylesterase